MQYWGLCMFVGAIGALLMGSLVRLTGSWITGLTWALVFFTGAVMLFGPFLGS